MIRAYLRAFREWLCARRGHGRVILHRSLDDGSVMSVHCLDCGAQGEGE